jgi:hypothetical protein
MFSAAAFGFLSPSLRDPLVSARWIACRDADAPRGVFRAQGQKSADLMPDTGPL